MTAFSIGPAYAAVFLIWSSMPLVMKKTVEYYSAFGAMYIRLAIALALVSLIRKIIRSPNLALKKNYRAYFWAGIGIVPSGPIAYWSSQYLHSGVYAIIYGLMPFYVLALTALSGTPEKTEWAQLLPLTVSFLGLVLLSNSQLESGGLNGIGLVTCVASALIFALSIVRTRECATLEIPLLNLINGSVLFGLICLTPFVTADFLEIVGQSTPRAIIGVMYLGAVGSVVSYIAYYYLLARVSAISMSAIFLATPIAAVVIGSIYNSEQYSWIDWFAICVITAGLALYSKCDSA